jgi:hypothetical protein
LHLLRSDSALPSLAAAEKTIGKATQNAHEIKVEL